MRNISDFVRGFIEGVLDSDGSITLNRRGNSYSGYFPTVYVSVLKELLDQIKLVVKEGRRKVALKLILYKEQHFKDTRFILPNGINMKLTT